MQAKIDEILSQDLNALLYAKTKDGQIYLIDIDEEARDALLVLFVEHIKQEFQSKETIKLSDIDERKDVLYLYDLALPDELKKDIDGVLDQETKVLSFNQTDISMIKGFFIKISNTKNCLIAYQNLFSLSVFKVKNHLFLIKSDSMMVLAKNDFLRLSQKFDFIKINDDFFIKNLELVEKDFGIDKVILKEAQGAIKEFEKLDILSDVSSINIQDNPKKLVKILKNSPVLKMQIPAKDIIKFCKTNKALKYKFEFDENDKIIIRNLASQRYLLKLLSDDFLFSRLTKNQYDSIAKNEL